MSVPAPVSIPPRLWSHELLKHAKVLVPIDLEGRLDRTRIGAIEIRHYSLEHGPGCVHKRGPSERDIARWLFGLGVIAPGYFDRYPDRAAEARRIFESFVRADESVASTPGSSAAAIRRRKQRAEEARNHQAVLRSVLQMGLERRLDTLLEGEEDTWIAFAARGYATPGLRVCEQCSLVFKGRSRTKRCPSCNRAPVTPTVRPAAEGGWHLDVRVGGYWADDVFDRTVTYTGICQHCSRRFSTNDPRGRYCENCKSPSGRQRRRRASRSTTGQAAASYVSAEGSGPLLSVGVAGPDGNGINLEAVNGVVTVTDLEYVRQLDTNPAVRQVDATPAHEH
jgi:Zn finger protein HypA/HybF involved in hydrogenase expression